MMWSYSFWLGWSVPLTNPAGAKPGWDQAVGKFFRTGGEMEKGGFEGRKTLVTGDGEYFCPPFILLPPVMTLPATQS